MWGAAAGGGPRPEEPPAPTRQRQSMTRRGLRLCQAVWPGKARTAPYDACELHRSGMARSFVTPMDCSPPGSSVHAILQARIVKRVAVSFSRGSSQPRGESLRSCYHLQGFPPRREHLMGPASLGAHLEKFTSIWVTPWCLEGERG